MNCPKKFLIIAAVAAVFVLAGCGNSPLGEDANQMVLYHALPTEITGLDPGSQRDIASTIVRSQIFETLYQYHYLKRPYQLVPLLAEEMPQVSEDKLTYTIKIKKGVYFQDDICFPGGKGRELRAGDFVFAIKRITNIKYRSQNWAILDNKIVGLDEFRKYAKSCKSEAEVDYSREAEGLKAADDYTLVIKLKKPWPQIVNSLMTDISGAPVAKEAVDFYGEDIISHPVGTGPFRLKRWQRGSYIELVRNPTFRGEAYPSEGQAGDAEAGYLDNAGRVMPFADRVVWTIIKEEQPRWFLFLQGKIDASAIPKDNFSEAIAGNGELTAEMQRRGICLKTFLDPSTYWLGFNMEDPVLGKNKPLRRAINYAIDREKFIELFRNNRDMVACGIIPPLMESYNPQIKEKGYSQYNPQQVRELLAEAGKIYGSKLPELKISVPGTETFYRQFGQFLERQLEEVGLKIEIEYMDGPTYWEKLHNRSLQMFASNGVARIPDSQEFLSDFYSKYASPGPNIFNYSNPEFDKLYEQAEVMPEGPERRELYQKMEIIVLEDCPAAFLNHGVAHTLCHNWYKNFKPHAYAYNLSKYRRVDVAERAAYKELLKKIK